MTVRSDVPNRSQHSESGELTEVKWSYDSSVAKLQEPSSQTSIFGHAETLLNSLARRRDGLDDPEVRALCPSPGRKQPLMSICAATYYLRQS